MLHGSEQASPSPVDRDRIEATERLIRPYIRHTPMLDADAAEFGLSPASLTFKLECLQHSGSFKARGAFANLLSREMPAAGVVAASGGNHGAAVAYAAARLGVPATIFVPSITSPAKVERIRNSGATLIMGGERYADALAASEAHVATSGALAVHAFEQVETLLGQGTLGLEMEADVPDADTILIAVGGGGLIGGIAAWYGGRAKIVAVEPEAAPTLHAAFAAGRPVDAPTGGIAADSLAPRRVGEMMFPLARRMWLPRWCWCPTMTFGAPKGRYGLPCVSSLNRVGRPLSQHCCPAAIDPTGTNGSSCWFAAATPPQ